MDQYNKGENISLVEDTINEVLQEIQKNSSANDDSPLKVISIKPSTKVRSLIQLATTQFNKNACLIVGHGPAVGKVVSLGELIRRRLGATVQWNSIRFTSVEEVWNPKEDALSGLQPLKVVRQVPLMAVLIVKCDHELTASMNLSNWTRQIDVGQFINNHAEKKSTNNNSRKRVKRKL